MCRAIVVITVFVCMGIVAVTLISMIPRTVYDPDRTPEVVVEIDDGDTAFPFEYYWNISEHQASSGMSLRDYFATEAMRSMVRNWPVIVTEEVLAETSRLAYDLCDRMIERRNE